MNGHVANHATISTKKVNFNLASSDADSNRKRAVQCRPVPRSCNTTVYPGEGEIRGPESMDRATRSELPHCQPPRSLSSPPSSTLAPRTVSDVIRNNKELIPEDGAAP